MAKQKSLNPKIILTARKFARRLKDQGIPVSKTIVFGSWAKGLQGKTSDLDLCIVSPKFGEDEIDELQFLLRQARYVNDIIEPLPISAKDYKQNATPLVCEIKKYGLEVQI